MRLRYIRKTAPPPLPAKKPVTRGLLQASRATRLRILALLTAVTCWSGCAESRLGITPPDPAVSAAEWRTQAQAAYRAGALNEAIVLAGYAVAAAPQDAWPYALAAGYYHAAGDFVQAATAYRAALQRDPDLREAYLGLGWALLNLGEIDTAMAILPPAGKRFDELHLRGALYIASGNAATGAALLREAKALADSDPRIAPLRAVRDIDCRLVDAAPQMVCPLGPLRPHADRE